VELSHHHRSHDAPWQRPDTLPTEAVIVFISAYVYSLNMMEKSHPNKTALVFLVYDGVELVYLMHNAHSKTHSKTPGVAVAHLNREQKASKSPKLATKSRGCNIF